jgi:hypothetical protein
MITIINSTAVKPERRMGMPPVSGEILSDSVPLANMLYLLALRHRVVMETNCKMLHKCKMLH